MPLSVPLIGTSLYSFTNEWQQKLLTLEQMVARVAEMELGPGLEVVGFQSFREFPDVSDTTAGHFRDLLARYHLAPTCLSGNVDIGRRRDRRMSIAETVSYIERQVITAEKLGFPVLRIQAFAGPEVLMKVAPIAIQHQVQVACELHSPLTPDHPEIKHLREAFKRLGSPYLGFVPDFSCSMTQVPAGYWENLRRAGAAEELISIAQEIWLTDLPDHQKYQSLAEAGARFSSDPGLIGRLNLAMTMFGHMDVAAWQEVLPYARHIHGKFYEVNEQGLEPSIPYPALMNMLLEAGYGGSISAEWEGSAFMEDTRGFEQVKAWHAMVLHMLGLAGKLKTT